MTFQRPPLPSLLAASGVGIWCLSVGFLAWPMSNANLTLRFALVLLAVFLTVAIIRSPGRRLLLAPIYLIGLLALVFYGLVPALYIHWFPEPIRLFRELAPEAFNQIASYVGSRGELFVLQFSAMCLALTAVVSRYRPTLGATASAAPNGTPFSTIAAGTSIFTLGLASLFIVNRWAPDATAFFSTSLGREALHALAPAMSLCLAMIAFVAARGTIWDAAKAVAIIGIALGAMVLSGLAIAPIYMAFSAILLFSMVREVKLERFFLALLVMIAVVGGAILGTAIVRGNGAAISSGFSTTDFVVAKLISKIVLRQGVSGNCLDRVVRIFSGTEGTNPIYFASAVIPRILWPEKPILSRGSEFAELYCEQKGAKKIQHSESITLIGEPILRAGMLGLVVAELFIAFVLIAITLAGLSGGFVRLIAMTAMLPWLVDFAQHFALYVGNMVKMFLIMLPFIAILAWFGHIAGRRTNEESTA